MNNYNNRQPTSIPPPSLDSVFALTERIPIREETLSYRKNPATEFLDKSPLAKHFFSKPNVQLIQNGIRAGVYTKSNSQYVIGEQDTDILYTLMKSVFNQHGRTLRHNVNQQLQELNNIVITHAVSIVYREAKTRMHYLRDIQTLPMPMATPISASPSYEKRTLEMPNWF